MHIVVCIKQVPDPEGSRDSFEINAETLRVEPRGIPPVLSLFDENALEAALRIKDGDKENTRVTVLSIGKRVADAVMLKSLAAGADQLVKVEDPSFEAALLDSNGAADILAAAINKLEAVDLVLTGRQAADWNAGQTGLILAKKLGFPCVTLARSVTAEAEAVVVERVLADGFETVRAPLPCVVMVSNEIGELRYPAMKERREARKKPVTGWKAADIGYDAPPAPRMVLKHLFYPEVEEGRCRFISGDSPADAGRKLAETLKQEQVIE